MSHSYLQSSHHLNKDQTAIEFLIFQFLLRNPSQIKLDLLVAYPLESFFSFIDVNQKLQNSPNHYSSKQLADLRNVAFRFIHCLWNASDPQNCVDVSPSTFFDSEKLEDQERRQFLHTLVVNPLCNTDNGKEINAFVSEHRNKNILRLCWLSFYFGVRQDNPLFVELFSSLPKTILFYFYRSLLMAFQDSSAKSQAKFMIYIDHFACMLQDLEIEEVKRSLKKDTFVIQKSNDLMEESSVDKACDVPRHPSIDSYVMVQNSEKVATISESKSDLVSTSLMSLDDVKKLRVGSRVDVLLHGDWINAEVFDITPQHVRIQSIFFERRSEEIFFFKDPIQSRFAFAGTKASDHLFYHLTSCLLHILNNFPHDIPNIILCNPSLYRVLEGTIRPFSSNTTHLASDVTSAPLSRNIHKQVTVIYEQDYVCSGCIEKVEFENDFYFYVLGRDKRSRPYCLLLSRNTEFFELPHDVSIYRPLNEALFTYHHQ